MPKWNTVGIIVAGAFMVFAQSALAAGDVENGKKVYKKCAACHSQSVVTCYNCHFEAEVVSGVKLPYAQIAGWKFLLRRERGGGNYTIDVGNVLAVTYQGKAFVAVAPYHAHTIDKNAVSGCDDCHNNGYVREYLDTGEIEVVAWNESREILEPNIKGSGIIPIPPDWRTALKFDFVTHDDLGPQWIRLIPSETGAQMLFAEPLEGMPQ